MVQKIAIIGAGQAASSFAAKMRNLDESADITMFGEETSLPYQRPPLSKKFMTGEMSRDQLLLRAEDWYEQNRIECRLNVVVENLDRDAKTLKLSSGETVSWDKLVFATGSRARMLPDTIGGNLPGVYPLRDLAHSDAIRPELVEGRKLVIVGGGYIGLEAAAVAASLGLEVTLLEASGRILQRVACAETSDYFRNLHESRGVKILENAMLERFEEADGRVSSVILSDGTKLEADFALVGIGIIPNTELAEAAGLKVEAGICVNQHCQTSDENIYAAGDCAIFEFDGQQTRLESVQNAIEQAECAADNIASIASVYAPVPWFWSDQYEIKLQIAGLNRGYDEVVARAGEREGAISHWYFNGGKFIAVDAMNDPRAYMVGKKLLEMGKGISVEQAGDTDIELKSLLKA